MYLIRTFLLPEILNSKLVGDHRYRLTLIDDLCVWCNILDSAVGAKSYLKSLPTCNSFSYSVKAEKASGVFSFSTNFSSLSYKNQCYPWKLKVN